ncbi:MAG: hypothetical protein V9E99_03550 [Microthrixaceae bacterium]
MTVRPRAKSMRGSTSGPATRGGRRALWWCVAATSVIAFGQGAWIWTHRMVGAFDPDEAGYLATSLRFARTFSVVHPYDFVYSVGATGTGPLVPLLSAPLVMIGPRDPRMAMMIQPVLAVVSALAVSAIARRFTSDAVAVVAGVAYATLPAVLLATQSYWFGLGTATALLVATWALLASDRGRGRGIWWFGVALGAMLLVRTMALGFAPGLVLGAALLVEPTRRGFLRLGGAIAIAAAIAGPWWIVGWDAIFGYLVSYGYGPRAGLFGSGGPLDRLAFRFDRIISSIGIDLYAWAAVAATIGVSLAIVRRSRPSRPSRRGRRAAAVVVGQRRIPRGDGHRGDRVRRIGGPGEHVEQRCVVRVADRRARGGAGRDRRVTRAASRPLGARRARRRDRSGAPGGGLVVGRPRHQRGRRGRVEHADGHSL